MARIIRHKKYNKQTIDYDIAVITLAEPAPIGANGIDRLCLPAHPAFTYSGFEAVVSGWGVTENQVHTGSPLNLAELIWMKWKLHKVNFGSPFTYH